MQAHRALIFKLIGLYCPKGEAADDAWNEIYIQVHGALGSFRGEAQASTWLYRVALNTLLTMQRKAYRRPATTAVEAAHEPGHDPEARSDAAERLHQAMVRLPEADRALIALHLEGFRAEEISETLGITANHVNVKVHRIKKQLQQWLTNP
jgi:RNA polymerase sigma-70 factor (ECF subfamily)